MKNLMRNWIPVLLIMLVFISFDAKAQTIYTNTGHSKYVRTTVDTFSVPGLRASVKRGFVTNQSATKQLIVYFSKTDGTKDTSSKVLIEPGKTLKFAFKGYRIFRNAVTDSAYSQVIIGDVQLNYNDKNRIDYDYALMFDNEFMRPRLIRVPKHYISAS